VDAALFSALNSAHAPWLDTVMTWVSWLGYFPGVWFLSAAATLLSPRLRASAFRACLAVSLTYVMASSVVKPLVARARPYQSGLVAARTVEPSPATGYSFPSGHAATAVAGALSGARIVPAAAPVLWGLATVMAVSRVYVGVHYPSDVVAGALLGVLCTYLVLGGRHPSAGPWPAPEGRDPRLRRP
jgi:undecaprenyl-diphosphatase